MWNMERCIVDEKKRSCFWQIADVFHVEHSANHAYHNDNCKTTSHSSGMTVTNINEAYIINPDI